MSSVLTARVSGWAPTASELWPGAASTASGAASSPPSLCPAGQPAEAAAGDEAAGGAQGGRERGGHAAALVQAAGHHHGRGHRLRERPHRDTPLLLPLQITLSTHATPCMQRP